MMPSSLLHRRLCHYHSALIFLLVGISILVLLGRANALNVINNVVPIVYSIAGSDSGGGAGIQADLHAIHSFGCHGCTAITCVTAQNSMGVSGVYEIPSEFLRKQLDSLSEDLPPASVKIGMIYSADNAREIEMFLSKAKRPPWVVCDPVMISTSGHALISEETKAAMIQYIFPYTDVLTPNKFEAEALLGRKLTSFSDIEQGKSI